MVDCHSDMTELLFEHDPCLLRCDSINVQSEETEEAKGDSDKSVLEENEGVLGKDEEVAQAIKAATETANYTKVCPPPFFLLGYLSCYFKDRKMQEKHTNFM